MDQPGGKKRIAMLRVPQITKTMTTKRSETWGGKTSGKDAQNKYKTKVSTLEFFGEMQKKKQTKA